MKEQVSELNLLPKEVDKKKTLLLLSCVPLQGVSL